MTIGNKLSWDKLATHALHVYDASLFTGLISDLRGKSSPACSLIIAKSYASLVCVPTKKKRDESWQWQTNNY